MPHEAFRFSSLDALVVRASELGAALPCQTDLSALAFALQANGVTIPNRYAIQPMEGCDGTPAGAPDTLTYRRYERFLQGGAGLVWFEATAVVNEGRANPRQLCLVEANREAFTAMHQQALAAGKRANGDDYQPYTVIQLTHSGRYSRPEKKSAPIIAQHDDLLDSAMGIPADYALASDQYLASLVPQYVHAARLAQRCGFTGVDIKCCHRYLLNELLAAHTRPGPFGGSFENRTRLLLEIVAAVRSACPDLAVWVRLNCYDGHPSPWGWGVSADNPLVPDLTEPLRLIGLLEQAGVTGINVTAGNPYFTPFINRPYDRPLPGSAVPDEHPLAGVGRLLGLARSIKCAYSRLVIIGSGFSWLRRFVPNIAAGAIEQGWMDLAGIGRGAFAYPDQVRDVLRTGKLSPARVCVTCSRCTEMMRNHTPTGCALFDKGIYGPIYKAGASKGA